MCPILLSCRYLFRSVCVYRCRHHRSQNLKADETARARGMHRTQYMCLHLELNFWIANEKLAGMERMSSATRPNLLCHLMPIYFSNIDGRKFIGREQWSYIVVYRLWRRHDYLSIQWTTQPPVRLLVASQCVQIWKLLYDPEQRTIGSKISDL